MKKIVGQKRYLLRIYDDTGRNHLKSIEEFGFNGFYKQINAGLSDCQIELFNKIDDLNESFLLKLNNQVKIFVVDKESGDQGKLIYSGYIYELEAFAEGSEERVTLTLHGNWDKAATHLVHIVEFGGGSQGTLIERTGSIETGFNTIVAGSSNTTVGELVKSAIDYYQGEAKYLNVNNELVEGFVDYKNPRELDSIRSLRSRSELKAYWRFESQSSGVTPSEVGGHSATDLSSPFPTVSLDLTRGMFRQASRFGMDGDFAGNGLSVTNHADLRPTGNFSIVAWFRTVGTNPTSQGIFQSFSQNTNLAGILMQIQPTTGFLQCRSGRNTGTTQGTHWQQVVSDISVADGRWHLGVFTWDGSFLNLYLDGRLESKVAWTHAPAYAATNYVRIGLRNDSGSNVSLFGGWIDDVALFNGYALTQEDVESIWDNSTIQEGTPAISYSFRIRTLKEMVDRALDFLPADWHYYIDENNRFHLKSRPAISSKELFNSKIWDKYPNDLKLYYRFEETTGTTVTDWSGQGNNGTASNADILNNQLGRFNGGGKFVRANSRRITFPGTWSFAGFDGDITIGFWFKADNPFQLQGLAQDYKSNGTFGPEGWRFYISASGRLTFEMGAQNGVDYTFQSLANDKIIPGKWYFVSLVFRSPIATLYINGSPVRLFQVGTHATDAIPGGNHRIIGAQQNTSGGGIINHFDGIIDDIFISRRPFTASEVAYLYYDNPKHTLTLGKDIARVDYRNSMAQIANLVAVSGDPSENSFRFGLTIGEGIRSRREFGKIWRHIQDQRLKGDSLSNRGIAEILAFSSSQTSTRITVVDSNLNDKGYDLESLTPGDGVKIVNTENPEQGGLFDEEYMIVSIDYQKHTAVIELESLRQSISRQLQKLAYNVSESDSQDLPSKFQTLI